jgi:hypothetical protein
MSPAWPGTPSFGRFVVVACAALAALPPAAKSAASNLPPRLPPAVPSKELFRRRNSSFDAGK